MEDASGVRVHWYVCFIVVAVSHTCCLGLTRTLARDGKDEVHAEASASESERLPQCAAAWTLFSRPLIFPPPLSPFALQEEYLDNLVTMFHGVGCCLLTPNVFLC